MTMTTTTTAKTKMSTGAAGKAVVLTELRVLNLCFMNFG